MLGAGAPAWYNWPGDEMKNEFAIAAGVLMVLAALLLASGTSTQDTTPRPQVAQVLATTLHLTPSATPVPTFTPIPTATPRQLTERNPSNQEILDLLFQYPIWGAYIIPSAGGLSVQRFDLDSGTPILVIAGQGATGTDGIESFPAAFGAVLAWSGQGYSRKFFRVQFGLAGAQVSVSVSPNERIVFIFREIGGGPAWATTVSQQTVVLNSCSVSPRLAELWGLDRRWQTSDEFECF